MALKGVRKSHGSRTQRSSRRGECSPRRKSGTGKSSLINVGACLYAPAVGHLILAAFSALLRRVGSNIRRAELSCGQINYFRTKRLLSEVDEAPLKRVSRTSERKYGARSRLQFAQKRSPLTSGKAWTALLSASDETVAGSSVVPLSGHTFP
jgi:hypothetical protein